MPVFWRLVIDFRSGAVAADDLYDADNPEARSDTGWPGPASAIENAIAAIKAAVRGQADTADGLLRRCVERLGRDPEHTHDPADATTSLADACATQDSTLRSKAAC